MPPPASTDPVPPVEARRPPFTLRARARSFVYAWRGIVYLVRSQHNARIHAAATLAVGAAGFLLRLERAEWCAVILAMTLVWTAEALNTAVEFLADEVSAAHRELIGKAKDAGAGAVLLSSVGAAAVGLIVFAPKLLDLLGGWL
jgi:diacylglycerol kinase (ATP)